MSEEIDRATYLKGFSGEAPADGKQKNALKTALDIRKFEIGLYWTRATYFWTFNAAALTGFFLLKRFGGNQSFSEIFVVASLGLVFSIAWYFVNRGSKAWQRNWEAHVDLLEDEIQGPLYKTGINRYRYKFLDLTDAFPFSVSKINQILSLFVCFIWISLILLSFESLDFTKGAHKFSVIVVGGGTFVAIWALYVKGRTSESGNERDIIRHSRKYRRVGDGS